MKPDRTTRSGRAMAVDAQRVAIEARMRILGIMPAKPPAPAPDMTIRDPKRRDKAHAKATRAAEQAYRAAYNQAFETARAPWNGCNAGRAIGQVPALKAAIADAPDVTKLWESVMRVRSVYARYWSAIGAPPPQAATLNLMVPHEPFGSDGVEVDTAYDCRTDEERVKDATTAMMHMEWILGCAGEGVAGEVKHVVLHDEPVRHLVRLIVGLVAVAKEG